MSTDARREFEEAFDTYADALFRHAFFRVSDRERAVDITQDTFMKSWDAVQRGVKIDNWKAFLFHILNNRIIDEYRKKKMLSLDALFEEDSFKEAHVHSLSTGSLDDAQKMVDTRLDAQVVRACVNALDEPYKTVITMRYLDEMQPREIGGIIGVSENVVSVRIHRGMKKLEDIIKKHKYEF